MSFVYRNGWYVEFFNLDRMRTKLPRSAFFSSDEALVEFIHRVSVLSKLGFTPTSSRPPGLCTTC
jgi:hypothetical protein